MTSFVIGRVVDPEVKNVKIKGEQREVADFGLLVGKTCLTLSVFDDDEIFEKATMLEDGDIIVAHVSTAVNKDEKGLRTFLRGFGECPEGLRETLRDIMKEPAKQSA